jgi:hypothetical protein
MSLMGWSSESMAARYQHVTDALRSEVASQVGQLIWDSTGSDTGQTAVMISRESLAAALAALEHCLTRHHGSTDPANGLPAALADLRAAMSAPAAPSGASNETETETRRSSQG